MQIVVNTIRDIDIIEKELNSISSGVLALPLEEDFQLIATNFVYKDKNIFFFVQNKELYKDIKFDAPAKFTAIREKTKDRKPAGESKELFKLFYISVNGIIKIVKEKKLKNSIKQSFIQKYSGKLIESDTKSKAFSKLVYIDSEELVATEEIGK